MKGKLTSTRFFSGNGDPPANKLPPRTTVRFLSRSSEMPLHLQRDLSRDHCKEDLDLQQEISCDILEETLSTTVTTPIPMPLPLKTQLLYISQYDDYAVIYLAVMPPHAYRWCRRYYKKKKKIQIQLNFKLTPTASTAAIKNSNSNKISNSLQRPLLRRCRCAKCSDATASISVWPPPPQISAMMPSRSVRGCPRILPDFFQPYCENAQLSTSGMPWPSLRYLCILCYDILPLSLLRHHGRPAARMPSPLSWRCLRPLLPPNPACYWDLAPPFPWGCPCIQCRDALTVVGRMPSPILRIFAAPYCGFTPLPTAKMPL